MMRMKDRQALHAKSYDNFMSMLDRMAAFATKAQGGPWVRSLHPGVSPAAARRTAARLRSGALNLGDPRLPAPMLADMIELSIEKERVVRESVHDIREQRAMRMFFEEKSAAERRRSTVAGFHRLKKSAEEAGPDSPAAEKARTLDRKLRKERGRGRKKRDGG
jgi:hypothetical protein